jgi:hypothetical protein
VNTPESVSAAVRMQADAVDVAVVKVQRRPPGASTNGQLRRAPAQDAWRMCEMMMPPSASPAARA